MRNRSGVAETEEAVAAMPLAKLNAEIARCLEGFQFGGSSQGRKSFFKRLVWLEAMREKLHGIPSPKRDFRQRRQ